MRQSSNHLSLADSVADSTMDPKTLSIVEKIEAQKELRLDKVETYINSNFILWYATEVESLWSVTASILSDRRKSMAPIRFEALLFLKENYHYWDLNLVWEVMHERKYERMQCQQNEDL